jgi:hypothetical protein
MDHTFILGEVNYDKAHSALNWHSSLTINENLQMMAQWYKVFYTGGQTKCMYPFCVEQINSYMDEATTKHLSLAQ